MSTSISLASILISGSNAERLALTPTPPPGVVVVFAETDTDTVYWWNATMSPPDWVAFGGGAGAGMVGLVIDGGGEAISTGVKGFIGPLPACTIASATVLSIDASATAGDIVVDIWKDSYANFPPTNADSITASAPPTLDGENKSQDSTLTGWTTSISEGDILGFNVDSAATVTKVLIALRVTS